MYLVNHSKLPICNNIDYWEVQMVPKEVANISHMFQHYLHAIVRQRDTDGTGIEHDHSKQRGVWTHLINANDPTPKTHLNGC